MVVVVMWPLDLESVAFVITFDVGLRPRRFARFAARTSGESPAEGDCCTDCSGAAACVCALFSSFFGSAFFASSPNAEKASTSASIVRARFMTCLP